MYFSLLFFFSSRRRHTRYWRDWSSDVCSSDLRDVGRPLAGLQRAAQLLVVGQALADVLDSDVDLGVLLLEEGDLVLDVGHPGPEGELGRGVEGLLDLLLGNRAGLASAVAAAGGGAAGKRDRGRDRERSQLHCCSACASHGSLS